MDRLHNTAPRPRPSTPPFSEFSGYILNVNFSQKCLFTLLDLFLVKWSDLEPDLENLTGPRSDLKVRIRPDPEYWTGTKKDRRLKTREDKQGLRDWRHFTVDIRQLIVRQDT